MRAAGVARIVEAGKAFRAYTLRGDHGSLGENPLGSEMAAGLGSDVHIETGKHLNSACGEMFTLCTAIHRRQTLTRQHRAVAHSGHAVQSRSGGGCAEAKLCCVHRHCPLSSLISISPPPSWLGLSSGTTAGQSARLACRRLSRACPALLAATNTRPAQSRHHPNTLLASDDTSLHPHTTLISHNLLILCH
jgi:hypothetical protein